MSEVGVRGGEAALQLCVLRLGHRQGIRVEAVPELGDQVQTLRWGEVGNVDLCHSAMIVATLGCVKPNPRAADGTFLS